MRTHARSIEGFTLIELVIVIVIIGILSTVGIVAYGNVQGDARDKGVLSDVGNIDSAETNYALKNAGVAKAYYSATGTDSSLAVPITSGNIIDVAISGTDYCIRGYNTKSKTYKSLATAAIKESTAGICSSIAPSAIALGGDSTVITNMMTNPSAEVDTSYVGASNATVMKDTTWFSAGKSSFMITPSSATNNDSFINLGGDIGALRMGMQAGKTYTISATIHLSAALAGSFIGNGSRQITAWYTDGGANKELKSSQAPNSAGSTRLSVTMSIPSTATGAWIRLYDGAFHNNGNVWWDSIMITTGSTLYNYADGSTASAQGWSWTGTAGKSTSIGPAL